MNVHNIRFDREHTYVISGEVLPKTVYIEAFDKAASSGFKTWLVSLNIDGKGHDALELEAFRKTILE